MNAYDPRLGVCHPRACVRYFSARLPSRVFLQRRRASRRRARWTRCIARRWTRRVAWSCPSRRGDEKTARPRRGRGARATPRAVGSPPRSWTAGGARRRARPRDASPGDPTRRPRPRCEATRRSPSSTARVSPPVRHPPTPLLPADRETHSRAKPRPLAFPPNHSQRSSSPCGSSRSSIAEARPPVCSNRSSRRRAAWCPSRSSRTSPPSTGAPSTRETRPPPRSATRDFANVSGTPPEACTGSSQPSTSRRRRTRTPTRARTTRTIEAGAATNTSERSERRRQPPRRRRHPNRRGSNRRGSNRRRRRARRLHRLRAHRLCLRLHLARRCSRR